MKYRYALRSNTHYNAFCVTVNVWMNDDPRHVIELEMNVSNLRQETIDPVLSVSMKTVSDFKDGAMVEPQSEGFSIAKTEIIALADAIQHAFKARSFEVNNYFTMIHKKLHNGQC